jgi:hypothetical protein
MNGLYPARNHIATGSVAFHAHGPKGQGGLLGGGLAHDQCGPASLGRHGVLGTRSRRSPHPKLTWLPPASRWLRCGEVFASSTSGEGVTSGEVFTSMNFADCIALIFLILFWLKTLKWVLIFLDFLFHIFHFFQNFKFDRLVFDRNFNTWMQLF